MKRKYLVIIIFCIVLVGLWIFVRFDPQASAEGSIADLDTLLGNDEDTPPPAIPASAQEVGSQPNDASALGGYDVLIADRGNNRIIEVTPDKRIVWQYTFSHLPAPGYGADDAFFADAGKTITVNLEKYHVIEQIDYQAKQVTWQYGVPGKHGMSLGRLYSPDDAYKLQNGDMMVADIVNCRIIEISPDKKIVRQYGTTRDCRNKPGLLAAPNGDTPLPNGHVLISTILNHSVLELDAQWKPVFSIVLPLKYPSDPQLTQAGNILIAEYKNPGKIIEITKAGTIVWEYDGENGVMLNKPSLAVELPNGNILANDDLNHRVIVIDKKKKHIVWQYGVTGKPGDGNTQLNIPDGVDIIKRDPTSQSTSQILQIHTVGEVTRHAKQFIGQTIRVKGYLLKKESGYVIFSDESTGAISSFDLPITGNGVDSMQKNQLYEVQGTFLSEGLIASNGNPDHLELSVAPKTP